MRAIIYYFTGTRNTLMVCEKYVQAFADKGVQCDLHPMNKFKDIPSPNDYELVGFTYPIHGFNAPYIVYRFVRRLPSVQDKKYFIIKTSGEPVAMNNASSIHLVAKLKKKGFSVLTNEYHYVMPYNMIFRHTDEQAHKMWQTAQSLIPIDAAEILHGTESHLKKPFLGRVVSWALRIEHPAMRINGMAFRVADNCIRCMKCVDNCPVQNISYDKQKDKFHFSNKCIMCARCAFCCPKDAIRIGVLDGWRVNGEYNFDDPDVTQQPSNPDYCRRAYERYYEQSEEKIRRSDDGN